MRVDIAIIFVGLIVQVNQPWSLDNTAVLPNAPGHKAELVIPKSALAVDGEIGQVPHTEVNGHIVIDLKNVDVRVRGTRGMFNRRTREYKEAVPSLKRVGGCRGLHEAVRRRDQNGKRDENGNPEIASFIDIRGGRMVPHTYGEKRLTFDGTDFQNRCAACSVMYEAELRDPTALLVFRVGNNDPVDVHLRKGSEILVRNIPNEPTDGHFHHALGVFRECRSPQAPGPTLPCRRPACTVKMFDWEGAVQGDGEGHPAFMSPDCIIDDA